MTGLLRQIERLNRPGGNKYTFNIYEMDSGARIRQAPIITLKLLAEVDYTLSDRESIQTKDKMSKILKDMSAEDRAELLRKLKDSAL